MSKKEQKTNNARTIALVITKGNIGGAQKRIYDLARRFRESGEEVIVCFGPEGSELGKKLEEAGIETHTFTHLTRSKSPRGMFRFVREMRKFLKKEKPDVMHLNSTNTLPGAFAARTLRKKHRPKVIFTFRGLSYLDPNAGTAWHTRIIWKRYFKHFLKYVDTVVFQCPQNMEAMKKAKVVESGVVISPGIDPGDLNFLSRENARFQIEKKLQISLDGKYVIGTVGRLSRQKNYRFLVESFADILKRKENAILVFFGDGPLREELEELVQENDLKKHVLFYGEEDDISRLLRALDLFVLPSYFEGISVALTEALFAGLPLLVSDVGGNAEQIYGKRSTTFTLNDAHDFLKKFEAILSEEGMKREDHGTIDDHIAQFLLENSSANYLKLYSSQG